MLNIDLPKDPAILLLPKKSPPNRNTVSIKRLVGECLKQIYVLIIAKSGNNPYIHPWIINKMQYYHIMDY